MCSENKPLGSMIEYICKVLRKTSNTYPLICESTLGYQRARNVNFVGNFENALKERYRCEAGISLLYSFLEIFFISITPEIISPSSPYLSESCIDIKGLHKTF